MQPKSCRLRWNSHATSNWPYTPRHKSLGGLHGILSPLSSFIGQHQHLGNHASAINTQHIPQRSIISYATVVTATEAPIRKQAIDAQCADNPAKSSSNRKQKQKQPTLQNPDSRLSQLESLRLLEWPELCQQVFHLLIFRKMPCLRCSCTATSAALH